LIRSKLRTLARFLPKSDLKRDTLIVAGGMLLGQAIQILTTPILGRLYTPSVFGDWALLYSVSLMAAAIGGLRYELAIVMAEDETEAKRLVVLQTICNSLTTFLTLFGVLLFRGELAQLIGSAGLASWLLIVPAITFLSCAHEAIASWLIRTRRFLTMAKFRVGTSVSTALTQIAAAWWFEGAVGGLIVGALAGLIVPVAVVAASAGLRFGSFRGGVLSKGALWQAARKYQNFPKYKVPYGFVGMVRERGLFVLLGIFSTTHVIGLFALALRLVYMPIGLVVGSLNSVLFQRAASAPDITDLAPMISRLLTKLALVVTPAFLLFAWYARDIFRIVMGPEWTDAGIYAAILAAPTFAALFANTLDRLLDVVHQQRIGLAIELSYSVLAVVGFAAALALLPGAVWAVAVFAGITVLYHVTWVLAVYRFCRFPLEPLVRIVQWIVLLSAGTALVLWLIFTFFSGTLALAVALGALAVYYGILLLPTRKPVPVEAVRIRVASTPPAQPARHP
jgi:O-antigen/teichoic acid export membrane protein